MNPSLGHWLFSTLGARGSRALRQPDGLPVQGTFNPDQGAVPDILTNAAAFRARYDLDLRNLKGSEIGEGRVPDKSELQQCVRGADNPCLLNNNTTYVITDLDVLDLRYVALNGRPVWEFIESRRLLCLQDPPNGECEQQLADARRQIAELRTELDQKNARIGQLETEVARLAALVPVVVPLDIDKTVALLKGAGEVLKIGPGVRARFTRLGRFVDALKARRP